MRIKYVIQIFLILSFLVFVATLTIFPIEDADIWFHLAHGRWIMAHGFKVPHIDPFSWPIPNLPVATKTTGLIWEWLSEVGVFRLYQTLGPSAIIIAKASVIATTLILLVTTSSRLGTPLYLSIPLLTLGVLASAERFLVRLEHLGNLYLVILVSILFILKKGATNKLQTSLLSCIPLLFLLWTNTHGSVPLGLFLLWLFAVLSFFNFRHLFKSFFIVALLSTFAVVINPYGKPALTFALDWGGLTSGRSLYLIRTYEWMPPLSSFHKYQVYVDIFKFLLILYWFAFARGLYRGTVSFFGFLVLLLATYLSLEHARNINVFVILGFLPVVESLSGIKFKLSHLYHSALLLLLSAFLISGSFYVFKNGYRLGTTFRTFGLGVTPIVAEGAVKFLNEQNISGNLLNQFEIGGYLMFASPERKVFMDGRSHYPEWFFKEYLSMGSSTEETQKMVDKYNIDYTVVMYPEGNAQHSVPAYLSESSEWALVYWDNLYLVFLKRTEKYAAIVRQFEYKYANPLVISQSAFAKKWESEEVSPGLRGNIITELERNIEKSPTNVRALLLLGGILEISGDFEQAKAKYEEATKADPNHAMAHLLLASMDIRNKDYESAKQELKKALKFNPDLAQGYLLLGQIEEVNKNYKGAGRYYQEALQKDPKLAQAYFRLGVIHAGPIFNRVKAQGYLLQALKLGLSGDQEIQAKQLLQGL